MDPEAATGVVARFYRHLDEREVSGLTSLMLPDGVWHRQGQALAGPAAIAAALARRSPSMRIHHLLTNAYAMPAGPDAAEVTAYMLVVRHEPGGPLAGPAPLHGVESIRTVRASLRATAGGWRIASLRGDPPSFAAPDRTGAA